MDKKRAKFTIVVLAVLLLLFFVIFVLRSEKALVTHPKGIIAQQQLDLMITNITLMLCVIIPTCLVLAGGVWYQIKKTKNSFRQSLGSFGELVLWIIPSVIIIIMATITGYATHKLDPFRPLESEVKPLTIQVVALDWKWLFIYPEQEIASLNFVQFPSGTPIHFELAADVSPMNSFWIPQLSGQIYAMTGMVTELHLMADEPGEYSGRAAEINGEGYAYMTFVVKVTSEADFEDWVAKVKESPLKLTDSVYKELAERSTNTSTLLYSYLEKDLFNNIVMKYMHP